MRLEGRVALVTGASRGIGAAIAKRLAADGAKLVLHARARSDKLLAVADSICALGGRADFVLGDLEEREAPLRIVEEAFAVHGALDILVCNAGGGAAKKVEALDADLIDSVIALNLRATMLATGAFARLTQSAHGRVIFISSGSIRPMAPRSVRPPKPALRPSSAPRRRNWASAASRSIRSRRA